MTDKNTKPPAKPLSNRPLAGAKPKPAAPSAPSSRFNKSSNLRSRFGATPIAWDVLPLGDTLVCFSLEGLGGSLKYMLDNDLVDSGGTYEAVLQSMEHDAKAQARLTATLDEVWTGYDMTGAMLVYTWRDTLRDVILTNAKLTETKPIYLRAFDPLLVLNVLARSRDNLLQPSAPASFDASYINRILISDDPRLVKLVQVSGYFEELVPTPPPPELEEGESE